MTSRCIECNKPFATDDDTEGFCDQECEMEYRAAWQRAIGNGFPDTLAVNHLDGDPTNNDLANLRLVNPRENRKQ